MIARKTAQLKGSGLPTRGFSIFDPGKMAGVCWVPYLDDPWTVESFGIEDVDLDRAIYDTAQCEFVVCEDFHLTPYQAKQQSGSGFPSCQIIGALKYACGLTQTPLYLCPPNIKRAGRMALTPRGKEARALCNNEHKRDAVDIAGYVLRELRR